MSTPTEHTPRKTATHTTFRLFSAALYSLGLFSILALICSAIAVFSLKVYSPLIYVPLWHALGPLLIIMGIWFYSVLRKVPRIPTRNWYWPVITIPLSVATIVHTLHSVQYATPLVSEHQWPTTLPLTGIVGIILTCLLAIPWSIIDGRIQKKETGHKSDAPSETETSTSAQSKQPPSWQRPALGAALAAVFLVITYAIITPPTTPVTSRIANSAPVAPSSGGQSLHTPQSLSGAVAWNLSKPASKEASHLLLGVAGPILIHTGKQGYVQGLSEDDGSVLWEWKLSATSSSEIRGHGSTTSPDGRYLAFTVEQSQPPLEEKEKTDSIPRVVLIDTATGKELWNKVRDYSDDYDGTSIVVTNRVAAIHQHVYDLATGDELWQFPNSTIALPGVRANETLLTAPAEEYRTVPWHQEDRSCPGCAIDEFIPVDDRTGKPKGAPLTNLLSKQVTNIEASRGWILIHNDQTGDNTLHNIDTGKEIPAPKGTPSSVSRHMSQWAMGQETLALTFTPLDNSQSERGTPQDYYFHPYPTAELLPIPSHFASRWDSDSTPIPLQGNHALKAVLLHNQPLPTVQISNINTGEALVEFAARDIHVPSRQALKGVSQILVTREGVLIHIGGSEGGFDDDPRPSQFVMLK